MNLFTGHQIVRDQDGCVVVLYLDQQLNEFSKEFFETQIERKDNLEKNIRTYLQERLPDLKVKTVKLMLGSLLVASIPLSTMGVASANTGMTANQMQTTTTYTVKAGDTLYKIAKQFGTTTNQLKSINGLTSNIIYIGQQLKVVSQQTGVHHVQPGDSLFKIANMYNVTVGQLKNFNGLQTNQIYVGQTLQIPNQGAPEITNPLPDGVFRIGNRGENVKSIQRVLNNLGYSLVVDGVYGWNTKTAIQNFQSRYAVLTNDGVYGPQTKQYLLQALGNPNLPAPNQGEYLKLVNKQNKLPANYVPYDLVVPNVPFPFTEYHPKKLMRRDAAAALEDLFRKAKQDQINLYATSGYRSYQRQEEIFNSNVRKHGFEAANQFSARPGESEHQTGLAMDVTSPTVNFQLTQYFGQTREGRWLKENAPQFGFIIRYPKGKEYITGYQYEPWHLRYVGRPSASEVAVRNITLEEFLG